MTLSSHYPPAAAGGSTATGAAKGGSVPPSGTPETDTGAPTEASPPAGATTSPPSARPSTKRGRKHGPPSGPDAEVPPVLVPPSPVWELMRASQAAGALEVWYLRGALDLLSAKHQLQLDPGCWVIARFATRGEPMDGWAAPLPPAEESQP